MSLNKAMLIGNVGADPEVRYLEQNSPNSAKVASFRLATTERYRDRNGETRENTEWHNIVAWRGNADVIERFVKKGTQLYVEGRIRSRSWDGQDGVKHFTTEIIADTIQLLGSRRDNPGADGGAQGGQSYGGPQGAQRPAGGYAAAPAGVYQGGGQATPQGGYGPAAQPQGGYVAAQPTQPRGPQAPVEEPDDDLPF